MTKERRKNKYYRPSEWTYSPTYKLHRFYLQKIAMWKWGKVIENKGTNMNFAKYFVCKNEEGYVLDPRIFSEEQQKKLEEYIEPVIVKILVQHLGDRSAILAITWDLRKQVYTYDPADGPAEWIDHKIHMYNGRYEWAIVESLTDLRCLAYGERNAEYYFKHYMDAGLIKRRSG